MVITFKQRIFTHVLPKASHKPACMRANLTRQKDVEHMIKEGKTYAEIADALGMRRSEVAQYAARLGICSKNKPTPRKKNKEGYTITYKKDTQKFEAWSTLKGKKYIGIYETEIEAKTAAIIYNMKITKKVIDS